MNPELKIIGVVMLCVFSFAFGIKANQLTEKSNFEELQETRRRLMDYQLKEVQWEKKGLLERTPPKANPPAPFNKSLTSEDLEDPKACDSKIEEMKRKAVNEDQKEFWSHIDSECYRLVVDSPKYKKKLEKQGYEVAIRNFDEICTEFCNVAQVSWRKMKDIGLNEKERKAVFDRYMDYAKKDDAACANYVTKCYSVNRANKMKKCLLETGNIGYCYKND